ncbi:hypothetical protein GIX45_24550 [Erwinia sp. CPCC 100877]|nr:hypothetical protein [Erwinia sp. CPCC 100877]
MKNDFIVYQSKAKQFLLIIDAIIMIGLSFVVFFIKRDDRAGIMYHFNYLLPIFGILGILFFGFGAIYLLKEFVVGKWLIVVK